MSSQVTTAERPSAANSLAQLAPTRTPSRGRSLLRQYARNRGAVVGAVIVLIIIAAALLQQWINPYDPLGVSPLNALKSPTWRHPMGTDEYGRDVFSRVMDGAHVSLEIGVFAVVISTLVGSSLGLVSGFKEGVIDGVIMRLVDMLLAFPGVLLALSIIAVLGANLRNVVIAVGIGTIPVYARVVRGSVLAVKNSTYIDAARVSGCSEIRIAIVHIVPNILASILVLATIGVAYSILNGAALSYLGLGVQPPSAEWGLMVSDGRSYLRDAWWMATGPGLALAILVLSINLVGDGVRDATDPRSRAR
ncbi:MAG TPA: ABC transporter permease [Thermomicrobiales bacterium]|nr:ABC transporter permease [Thermomicrobiales bacterium]